jgi:hypothetical protein
VFRAGVARGLLDAVEEARVGMFEEFHRRGREG